MDEKSRLHPVSVKELEEFCRAALRRCGVSDEHARITADVLVGTDLCGVFTHGVKLLRGYVRRLRAGGIKADAVPRVVREGPTWVIVDGGSGLGMVTSVFAMQRAIEKARSAGMAYAGVVNSCHFGAAGYYAKLAAQADMIGLAMANDYPSIVAPGARKAVLGTNPFAYAAPAGREDPVWLDIASSTVAGGKVRIAQAEGKPVPDSWLVDLDGLPTTDPFTYPASSSLQPFAGHKGYGIAMMIEILAGALAGGALRYGIQNWVDSDPALHTNHGAAFLALNVGAIVPVEQFKKSMDSMIREIHETLKAKGAERILVPGEMEWQKGREAQDRGIALPEDVRDSLRSLAADLEMKVDWL
jgi:ureidoglycolate dehydrogenase (NAD+)